MKSFLKDPDAKLDFGFDWAGWLATGETVLTATWSVPAGLTNEGEANDGEQTIVWISGGTLDTEYIVKLSIVTSDGREDDRSLRIKITNR